MDEKITDDIKNYNNNSSYIKQATASLGSIPFNVIVSLQMLIITLLYSLVKKNVYFIKFYIIPLILISIITFSVKILAHRTRPICKSNSDDKICYTIEKNLSFPSGHMSSITTIILPIIFLVKNNVKLKLYRYSLYIILCSVIFFTGIERISSEYHYFTDVFAGFILGCFFVYIYYIKYDLNLKFSKNRQF